MRRSLSSLSLPHRFVNRLFFLFLHSDLGNSSLAFFCRRYALEAIINVIDYLLVHNYVYVPGGSRTPPLARPPPWPAASPLLLYIRGQGGTP